VLPTVLLTGGDAQIPARSIAKRHGVRVVGVAASPEDAAPRVEAGEAEGILDVTPGGWVSLVLPAGGLLSPAEVENLASGLKVAATAMTAVGAISTDGASAGLLLMSAAVEQAMAERRQRGQRVGPRPAKPPRRLIEDVIDQQRDPKRSLRAIADSLNERGEPTLKGTGKWHPASVKRLIDGSRAETRIILRRLGGLLDELQQHQPVDDDALARLGVKHGFHHHRLWLAFERGFGHPYCSGLIPPVEKTPGGYVVSQQGAELLRIWKRSEELDDALQPFCLEIQDAGGALDPQTYGAICAEHNLDASQVPSSLVDYDTTNGRFTLTTDGHEVAQVWRRLAATDPRERLDIDFWPQAHEEEQLRPDWDWEDDPLVA
jgi:hypothetical protein